MADLPSFLQMPDQTIIPQQPPPSNFSDDNTSHKIIAQIGQNNKDTQDLANLASSLSGQATGAIQQASKATQARDSYIGGIQQKQNDAIFATMAAGGMNPEAPGYIVDQVMSNLKNEYLQHADITNKLQKMVNIDPLSDPLGYLGAAFHAPAMASQLSVLEDQIESDTNFVGKAGDLATSMGKANALSMAANANTLADLTNAITAAKANAEAANSAREFTLARGNLLHLASAGGVEQINAITAANTAALQKSMAPLQVQTELAHTNMAIVQSNDLQVLSQQAKLATDMTGIPHTVDDVKAASAATGGHYFSALMHDKTIDLKAQELLGTPMAANGNISDIATAKTIGLTGRNPTNPDDSTDYTKTPFYLGPTKYGDDFLSTYANYNARPDLQNRPEYTTLKYVYNKAGQMMEEANQKEIAAGRPGISPQKYQQDMNSTASSILRDLHNVDVDHTQGSPFGMSMGQVLSMLPSNVRSKDPLLAQMQTVYGIQTDQNGKIISVPEGARTTFNPNLFIQNASQLIRNNTINPATGRAYTVQDMIPAIKAALNTYGAVRDFVDPSIQMGLPKAKLGGSFANMPRSDDMTNTAVIQAALVRDIIGHSQGLVGADEGGGMLSPSFGNLLGDLANKFQSSLLTPTRDSKTRQPLKNNSQTGQ